MAAAKKKTTVVKPVVVTVPQKVFVAKTGDVAEINFKPGLTLGEAIKSAGHNPDTVTEVRVNNKRVKAMSTKLQAGDQVILLGKIAGA